MTKFFAMIFACASISAQTPEELGKGEFSRLVTSTGAEIPYRRLNDHQKSQALENLEGINRYVVDELTDFQIRGKKMYVDAEGLETDEVLVVVSPKDNEREVLEIEPLDFIYLILESIPLWGVDDSAKDYFYLMPFNQKILDGTYQQRTIDPHECENTHPQDEPHRTEPENEDAPCHGEVGNNGQCRTETSSIDYFISCFTRVSGNGQSTRDLCVGHIECKNGAGFLNGTGNTTRFINCTSARGANSMVVGIDDMGQAFVKCGSTQVMTLDCPD